MCVMYVEAFALFSRTWWVFFVFFPPSPASFTYKHMEFMYDAAWRLEVKSNILAWRGEHLNAEHVGCVFASKHFSKDADVSSLDCFQQVSLHLQRWKGQMNPNNESLPTLQTSNNNTYKDWTWPEGKAMSEEHQHSSASLWTLEVKFTFLLKRRPPSPVRPANETDEK